MWSSAINENLNQSAKQIRRFGKIKTTAITCVVVVFCFAIVRKFEYRTFNKTDRTFTFEMNGKKYVAGVNSKWELISFKEVEA